MWATLLWLSSLNTACLTQDDACQRQYNAQGQVVLTCPRHQPVILSQAPAQDAVCLTQGDGFVCGKDRYDAQGQYISPSDAQEPDQTPDLSPSPDEPAPSAWATGAWASCTRVGAKLICQDGLSHDTTLGPTLRDQAQCISLPLPGVGRRIVCQQDPLYAWGKLEGVGLSQESLSGLGAQLEVLIPDEDANPNNQAPSCERIKDLGLYCTDGSWVEQPTTECLNPTLEGEQDHELIAACLIAESECIEACTEALNCDCERSSACQEATTPKMRCADGSTLNQAPQGRCIAPQGRYLLTEAKHRELLKGCVAVTGDIYLQAPADQEGLLPTQIVPLSDKLVFKRLKQLNGSLVLESGSLSLNRDRQDQWLQAWEDLELKVILGAFVVRRIEGMIELFGPPGQTKFVGSSVVLEQMPKLNTASLFEFELKHIRGGLTVQSNPELEHLPLPDANIDFRGALLMAENPRLPVCQITDWLELGLALAQSVLIAVTPTTLNMDCP